MLHTLADVFWLESTETPPQFILKLSRGSRDLSEGKYRAAPSPRRVLPHHFQLEAQRLLLLPAPSQQLVTLWQLTAEKNTLAAWGKRGGKATG